MIVYMLSVVDNFSMPTFSAGLIEERGAPARPPALQGEVSALVVRRGDGAVEARAQAGIAEQAAPRLVASGSALCQHRRGLLDQRPALAGLPGQACLHAQIAQIGRLLELG